MTQWSLKVDRTVSRRIGDGSQTAIVRYDLGNDFQKGDTVSFDGEAAWLNYRGVWSISHVIKNQNGLDHPYAVLCLHDPQADTFERTARSQAGTIGRLNRSNAALRGAITKYRKRLGLAA